MRVFIWFQQIYGATLSSEDEKRITDLIGDRVVFISFSRKLFFVRNAAHERVLFPAHSKIDAVMYPLGTANKPLGKVAVVVDLIEKRSKV